MMTLKRKESINEVDWQALVELIDTAGLGLRELGDLENAFRHSAFCWFGYEQGKLIAVARAISDMTWCSYLSDVAVAPHQQGKGYGRQLMEAVREELLPFGKIFIYAAPDKIGFYQSLDFELLSTGMVCAKGETLEKMQKQGYIRSA
ncbi:GNAT family N-acetyltransferase [Ewingella sp. AOP8-B2-18]|nr:GNAT family N-acetyltransferase [Pseudomonas reactans]